MNSFWARLLSGIVPFRKYRHKLRARLMEMAAENHIKIDASFGGSFKQYILENNIPEKLALLKRNLGPKSVDMVDALMRRMMLYPEEDLSDCLYVDPGKFFERFATDEEKECARLIHSSLSSIGSEYTLAEPVGSYERASFFLLHHGFSSASDELKRYIAGKDFLDIGAWDGESALVLLKHYRPRRVFSFEMSKGGCDLFKKTMRANSIDEDKCVLVEKAISNKPGTISFSFSKSSTSLMKGDGASGDNIVEMTTVDDFVAEHKINVGLIKADIEGAEMQCVEGMAKTLRSHRPALSICMYHNPEQFFGLKPLIEDLTKGLDYRFEIKPMALSVGGFREFGVIAYPGELT